MSSFFCDFRKTFTYDSEAGRGAIYVNGELDSEKTDQQGPNGNGPILIGARNGGEHPFHGLVDDLAIWQSLLEEDQIQALAQGISPSGRDNDDDDVLVHNLIPIDPLLL